METISGLVIAAMIILLFGTWIHAIATYDWEKFEEDKKRIEEDPYSHFP